MEAEFIQQTLAFIGDHPPDCSCCETMRPRITWTTIFHRICQHIARFCNWEMQSFGLPVQKLTSQAQRLYTPPFVTAPTASPPSQHSTFQITPPISSPGANDASGTQSQRGCLSADLVIQQGKPLWIVFGVKNTPDFDDIENIEMTNLLDDPSFFQELRERHNKHRSLFRRWFSPFRFRNCRFVRVSTTSKSWCPAN